MTERYNNTSSSDIFAVVGSTAICFLLFLQQSYQYNAYRMITKAEEAGQQEEVSATSTTNNFQFKEEKKMKSNCDDNNKSSTETMNDLKQQFDNYQQHLYYKPNIPYPQWDYNWDGRNENVTTNRTRHIILIRHGQYVHKATDTECILTPLGQQQAVYTGQRLAKMINMNVDNNNDKKSITTQQPGMEIDKRPGPCYIKAIHVSSMTRAIETANIITKQLLNNNINIVQTEPDPLLNEALPAPIIPIRPDVGTIEIQTKEIEQNHKRIEQAFYKYIHREDNSNDDDDNTDTRKHEFEIIVGHANVIRYLVCRALQIPPEAWLRISLFNCSITYIMIQPNGYVSIRLLGDTGHIPYEQTTFSNSYGYNWNAPNYYHLGNNNP